jgi:hypothetical protein
MRNTGGAAAVLVAAFTSTAFAADVVNWQHEIGYGLLIDEYGAALKTGAGVPVTLVEAGYAPKIYMPDGVTLEPRFAGKTFSFRSGTPVFSDHATNVAAYFFSNHSPGTFTQRSLARGVTSIDLYSTGWLDSHYLRNDAGLSPPPVSPNHSRVASHAYHLSSTTGLVNYMRRIDYLTHTDDYLHFVASTGGSGSVQSLAASYNAVAVGHPSGLNAEGGTVGLYAYPEGRHKPDIVVTHTTSDSIGIISGAAAMLIELGADPALSNGAYTSPRTGQTIRHAQTSETIKAALMAGAMRHTTYVPWTGHAITTYRDTEAHRTDNGLDTRYGAGRLNVQHSYKIIAAGEQDSAQDAATSPTAGHIGAYGFDYDPAFGGAAGSNAVASYRFATAPDGGNLTATLAWNAGITYTVGGSFDLTANTLFHAIELLLYDVTDAAPVLVASSSSAIDNTQSLWQDLPGERQYLMQVQPLAGQEAFVWDYALAWRIDGWAAAAIPEPASAALLWIGLAGMLYRPRR